MEERVYFACFGEGRRLRVRITSRGFHNDANCQFPRAIRRKGGKYSVPLSAVKLAQGTGGKYFYRVNAREIRDETSASIERVFGDDSNECVVCMDEKRQVVIAPCGHYCMCDGCANLISSNEGKCPLCRGDIEMLVSREDIQ